MFVRNPTAAFAVLVLSCAALGVAAPPGRADEVPTGPVPATGSIVAHAAGDRHAGTGAPVPLAGAMIRAYADPEMHRLAGECTTDASGSCAVTGLATGRYVVVPHAPPPGGGFERVSVVSTSLGDVGPYADTVDVDGNTSSTRTLVFRRTNPPIPARCGVRLILSYDLSASITGDEVTAMIAASLDLVDLLAGTSSKVGVASFATRSPADGNVDLDPVSVSTPAGVETVKQAIAALRPPSGDDHYTNWDAAFRAVVGGSDVVVLLTDGNPTVYGVPAVHPPVVTGLDQIDAGVLSANAVKARGTRVLALGVGTRDELSPENLAAVSGPSRGRDYAITSFAEVGAVLRALADELCPRDEAPPVEVPPVPVTTSVPAPEAPPVEDQPIGEPPVPVTTSVPAPEAPPVMVSSGPSPEAPPTRDPDPASSPEPEPEPRPRFTG